MDSHDIWSVASWAGIDYYGRWKALHYVEKRMFAPIMVSCEEKGDEVVIAAKAFAQKVWIEGVDGDVRFSDHCFDTQAGERRVKIVGGRASGFKVRSVYDIAESV